MSAQHQHDHAAGTPRPPKPADLLDSVSHFIGDQGRDGPARVLALVALACRREGRDAEADRIGTLSAEVRRGGFAGA